MKIMEVVDEDPSIAKLTALAQFVSERTKETDAEIGMSVDAFIELAHDMGVSVSQNNLYDLIKTPPLNNLVKDISDNKILFYGQNTGSESGSEKMSVDQSQKIVSKMAKRASDL